MIDTLETPLSHTLQNKLKYWFENFLNILYFPDSKTHQDFIEGKCEEKILSCLAQEKHENFLQYFHEDSMSYGLENMVIPLQLVPCIVASHFQTRIVTSQL